MLFKIHLLVRHYKPKLMGTRPKTGDINSNGLSVWCKLVYAALCVVTTVTDYFIYLMIY